MLLLKDIVKEYQIKDNKPVQALKGVTLAFRDTGFVAILGPSGCGKTTLLNIIGGLDKYTSGDVIINGQSTTGYSDRDWDAYRNREIGIVFQNYNLIPHLTILGNVELAMTLSGVSAKERSERAKEALEKVGLSEQVNKKPNQLSGGQMQRVALARALVNKPDIILADEPTGALDSKTSVQVMDILKEISKTKLVITVTHNEELADKYADRIIRLSDGRIVSDSGIDIEKEVQAVEQESRRLAAENAGKVSKKSFFHRFVEAHFKRDAAHTSMSMPTALGISGRNLLTKKAKTIITAVAASIGIIGVGLVLALSNGFSNYVGRMEQETLSKFPMSVEKYGYNFVSTGGEQLPSYPEEDQIHVVEPSTSMLHTNNISKEYIQYLENINVNDEEKTYASFRYNYSIGMHVIGSYQSNQGRIYSAINTSQSSFVESMASSIMGTSAPWQELPASQQLILEQYDILEGVYPSETFDDTEGKPDQDEFGLVLVVDSRNSLSTNLMRQLGLDPTAKTYDFDDIIGQEFKYVPSEDYYGDPIPYQELDETTGELVSVTTPGFFFRKDVTMDEIVSVMTAMGQGDESSLSSFMDLLDMPSVEYISENITQILSDPTVLLRLVTLQSYLDITLEDIQKIIESGNITADDIRSFFKEDVLSDENKMREAGEALYDLVIAIRDSDPLKDYFNRQLYYFDPADDQASLKKLYESDKARTLKISCILRPKKTTSIGLLNEGIYYPSTLTYQTFADNSGSPIAEEFKNHIVFAPNQNVDFRSDFGDIMVSFLGQQTTDWQELLSLVLGNFSLTTLNIVGDISPMSTTGDISDYMNARLELGSDVSFAEGTDFLDPLTYASFVSSITIYPSDYDSKQYIVDYLNAYNEGKDEVDKIVYTDVGQIATDMVGQIVQVISAVLIAFASISLVVSSVMIAIIIYSSVIERTKEIGILRSIGARKKDVSRLFKAEAVIIGFLSGLIGIVFTYIVSLPISAILNMNFPEVELGQIAFLNPLHALILLLVSVILTYVASLVPSRIAAKKDPVTCLRTE